MRTILAAALVLACAAGLSGQDDKDFKDGKFTAKFPTKWEKQVKSAGGLKLNVSIAPHEKDKGGYMVVWSDLPSEKLKAPTPDQVLDSCKKALEDDFKLKDVKAEPIALGAKKLPARKISGTRDELNLRGMLVLSGTRLYQVYVFGPKDFTTSKEADAFLESFAVTD